MSSLYRYVHGIAQIPPGCARVLLQPCRHDHRDLCAATSICHMEGTGSRGQAQQHKRGESEEKEQVDGRSSPCRMGVRSCEIAGYRNQVSFRFASSPLCRFPIGGDVPLREQFYRHQRVLIAVLFMEWCGVRREIVAMQTTGNLRFDAQGKLIYKPPPEKISQSAGREFPIPEG